MNRASGSKRAERKRARVRRPSYSELLRIDAELARLGRGVGALGLEIGFALERLKRKLWHRELGYSTLQSYAVERCSRTGRWATESAALARRLESLPALMAALVEGRINTSMATLVSQHAEPRTDDFLAAKAERCTVRQMREYLRGLAARNESMGGGEADEADGGAEPGAVPWWEQPVGVAGGGSSRAEKERAVAGSGGDATEMSGGGGCGGASETAVGGERDGAANDDFVGEHYYCLSDPPGTSPEAHAAWAEQMESEAPFAPPPDEPRRTLRVSVGCSDLLLFERSMALLRQLEGHADEDTLISAALAEADVTLVHALSKADYGRDDGWEQKEAEQREWETKKAEMRAASEKRCEAKFRGRLGGAEGGVGAEAAKLLQAEFERARKEIEAAKTPRELDRWIWARSHELSRRDLEVGRLWERMQRADGWRVLGYASPAQYARERVGMCLDALASRKYLARRVEELPALGEALREGRIGFEAARKIARVATGATVQAWIEQATERTVKHLREEVDVAERLRRVAGKPGCKPPTEEHMRKLAEVEQDLLTGEVELETGWPTYSREREWTRASEAGASECEGQVGACEGGARCARGGDATEMSGGGGCSDGGERECRGSVRRDRGLRCSVNSPPATEWGFVINADGEVEQRSSLPWLLGLVDDYGRPTAAHEEGGSGGERRATLEQTLLGIAAELCLGERSHRMLQAAQRMLTFRLRADTYRYWKRVERLARRWLPRGVSFLRFISLCIWNAHRYEVQSSVAYAHIYARDGYRCTSPVCCQRTVQSHHLRKRSQGGGDEDENLTALCCDCHLEGVHQGRIAVEPPASRMLWSIGRDGGLVVLGRKKIRDVPDEATPEEAVREGQKGGDEAAA